VLPASNETGALEHAEVLVDRGEGDGERPGELRDRRVPPGEPGEDRPARGVRERREDDIEGAVLILNHMVNYRACPRCVKSPPILGYGNVIYMVGHSTRTLEDFLALLAAHGVGQVVDVRRYPASRRHPHFAKDPLALALAAAGIAYGHASDLGGRRAAQANSPNTAWRNAGFRGYADYMETPAFTQALARLIDLVAGRPSAVLCAEAVPWRCHRQLLADALVARGIEVRHIIGPGEPERHRLSPHARVLPGGRLCYPAGSTDQMALC